MIDTESTEIVLEAGREDDSTAQDVMRCLKTLYSAQQALDRDFGIDREPLGLPMSSAKALMAAEYVAKTARYEPRARVLRVEWSESKMENGILIPRVVVEIV